MQSKSRLEPLKYLEQVRQWINFLKGILCIIAYSSLYEKGFTKYGGSNWKIKTFADIQCAYHLSMATSIMDIKSYVHVCTFLHVGIK